MAITIPIVGETTVDGVSKELVGGYVNINGIQKQLVKSYGNINGTWYPTWKTLKTYGDLSIGETITLNVNGTPYEWIVVQQGRPSSSVYDSSCDGTWLLMKDIYESRDWGINTNNYANSGIHSYLNDTFINLFDSDIKGVIKQVKLPYTNGVGNTGSLATGSNGISARVFLLSCTEINYINSSFNTEGAVLSFFNGAKDSNRIAYYNGTATYWWTRSPYVGGKINVGVVFPGGSIQVPAVSSSGTLGVRPAIIMPSQYTI